jgi:hypothetical protein
MDVPREFLLLVRDVSFHPDARRCCEVPAGLDAALVQHGLELLGVIAQAEPEDGEGDDDEEEGTASLIPVEGTTRPAPLPLRHGDRPPALRHRRLDAAWRTPDGATLALVGAPADGLAFSLWSLLDDGRVALTLVLHEDDPDDDLAAWARALRGPPGLWLAADRPRVGLRVQGIRAAPDGEDPLSAPLAAHARWRATLASPIAPIGDLSEALALVRRHLHVMSEQAGALHEQVDHLYVAGRVLSVAVIVAVFRAAGQPLLSSGLLGVLAMLTVRGALRARTDHGAQFEILSVQTLLPAAALASATRAFEVPFAAIGAALAVAVLIEALRFVAVMLALGRLSPWLQRRLTDPPPIDRATLLRVYGIGSSRSDT